MRIWLMKTTVALLRLTTAVSLRSACDMRRACRPMCESPISPSISALGTSAATESMTTRSTAPERTSVSVISTPWSLYPCADPVRVHCHSGPAEDVIGMAATHRATAYACICRSNVALFQAVQHRKPKPERKEEQVRIRLTSEQKIKL